jgi:glycosyltransferase involved in cell wall biosynthesis
MINTARTKTMLWWGRFDPTYSRNRILRSLLRQMGWQINDFMPLISSLAGVQALFKRIARPDAVWVPAFRQRDFSSARSFADRHGIPLIFDPLISVYDKVIFERKKFGEADQRARAILKAEQGLFSRADLVIADTEPHARFFVDVLAAPAGKTHVIPVGAEEGLFTCQPSGPPGDPPEVFFYGSFISLQGTETIINAAIQVPEARWTLLGTGPQRRMCEEQSKGHSHIRFEAPILYQQLPERIGAADILLGIFGSSPKAGRVIPNKVYQSLACGRPLITRQSPAYPELLQKDPACGITFIPPGDPAALAGAVRDLLTDPTLLAGAGNQASNSYQCWFSLNHIQEALTQALARLSGIRA